MSLARGSQRKALIIGCGIAGPMVALFLKRAGIDSAIFEGRAAPNDEAGSFLGLAPNGRDVLGTLGMREAIESAGVPTPGLAFLTHQGKQLGVNPQPVITIKRGALNQCLRDATLRCKVPIEWGKRLADVQVTKRGPVVARFDDGSEAEGDFIIGCDGIHSATRRALFPNTPPPVYTGLIATGGYTRLPSVPSTKGVMQMTFGLKAFFGYQVLDSGEIYWFNNLYRPTEPNQRELDAIPNHRWREEILETHRSDHTPIPEIIRSTEGAIAHYPIYEMPSLETWHRDRVCLVGDAVHAMGPHTGQGASMAMEDAIVLAKCLRDSDDISRAFAAYEGIRKERVEFVVRETRRLGNRKAAPPGPFGRWMRDLMLPMFLKKGVQTFDPIYAFKIDWDTKVA